MREVITVVVIAVLSLTIYAVVKEDPQPVQSMYPGLQTSVELERELLPVNGRKCGPLWPSRVAVDGGVPTTTRGGEVAMGGGPVAEPSVDVDAFVKLMMDPRLSRYDATLERFATDDDSFLESITAARDYKPELLFAEHLLPPEHPFWTHWEFELDEIQAHAANIETLADLYPVIAPSVGAMYVAKKPYFRAYQEINRTQWVLFALTGKSDAELEKRRKFLLHDIIGDYPSIQFLYALKQALRGPR